MKTNKKKIEIWINSRDHDLLKLLSKKAGYTMAEVMRRAAEEKIVYLQQKIDEKEIT